MNEGSQRRLAAIISADVVFNDEKGFGFIHGKPPTAFSPVAITPDELEDSWKSSRVSLPFNVELNGAHFGNPDAQTDMVFNFAQLISHAAVTRPLCAGTIIGSGT